MGLGDLLDHREAEAGAAVDSAGAVGLPEALPDVGQVLLVYAYARVGDGEGVITFTRSQNTVTRVLPPLVQV